MFVDVAKPMSDAPPSKNRPSCAAATIVDPNEYVSGSAIVLCWLVVFVNGSTAIWVSATFALAATGRANARAPASASTREERVRRGDGGRNRTKPPFRHEEARVASYEEPGLLEPNRNATGRFDQ